MKMIKTIIIVTLCWYYASYAYSSTQPTLNLYTEKFPPYSYLEHNQIVGINSDIVKQACVLAAITCNIKIVPWNRAIALTNNSASGIYSMSRNQERENNYRWVGPLINAENYLFRLKSRSDVKVSDISSAIKYSIAVPRNDIYEKSLKDRGFKNLLQVSSKFKGVKLFLAGKIDLLIASPLTLPYQLAEHGTDLAMLEQLIPLPLPELQGNYLALHPEVAPEYVHKLQQALDTLHKSGKVDNIIRQYKNESFQH